MKNLSKSVMSFSLFSFTLREEASENPTLYRCDENVPTCLFVILQLETARITKKFDITQN